MARLPQINQLKQSKAAQEAMQKPVEQTITPQSVAGGFQSMGEFKPQQPVLQTRNAQADYNATRSQALGHESNLADPEKAQKFWNASPYEYWTEQVKANPESTYAIVNQMFASNETPEEKAKRERREALGETFRGLGNLIGNAANLYYATKGGTPIDLNTANEKHLARMQRIKDKQDALDEQRKQMIVNAKLSDVKTARAERAAKAKTDAEAAADALKYKRDLALKQIENAYKLGQIDAETKAKYAEAVLKAKSQKDLEDYRQKNRESLAESNHQRIIEREEARGGGSRATIRIPRSDGNGYDEYRKNDLTNPTVVSQIYHSLPDEYKSTNAYESPTMFDMQAAIGKALKDGKITEIAPDIKVGGKSEKDNTAPHRKKGKGNSDNVPPYKKK